MTEIVITPYRHQTPVIQWFERGGKRAYELWHRKAGKDRVATFIESMLAFKRVGLYWHALPHYEDARKVIWDAITPEGVRLIDACFPRGVIKRRLDHEMKLELVNGSIWQPIGADSFDSLVGAFPVHVTYSEFALMDPRAREFIRPALAASGGTELIITTPRGYNHAYKLWEQIRDRPEWHKSVVRASESGILSPEVLEEERESMPDELYRQEYECDWSASNVGSILGRYIEGAEREGRIGEFAWSPGAPVHVVSDIGFRDTAAWWFIQPRPGGFACIKYLADSGLDAEDWIGELRKVLDEAKWTIDVLWLPHDARAKTFRSKRTVVELFLSSALAKRVEVVPALTSPDKVNGARIFAKRCYWNREACAEGLEALRGWQFKYDEETRAFSKEPDHNWASHGGDAFAYAGTALADYVAPPSYEQKIVDRLSMQRFKLAEMWDTVPRVGGRI